MDPRKGRKIFLWIVAGSFLLWLAASGLAGWRLTARPQPRRGEDPPTGLEEHRLQTADGIDLGAWLLRPDGNRPTLLLLHGNGASRSAFARLLPFLANEGLGALALTLRAHGDSAGDVNDFGYSARQDVLAAVAFVERERPGRPILIVGESLGAAAALFAAADCAGRVKGYLFAAPYDRLDTAIWNRCDVYLVPPFTQAAYAGLLLWGPVFLPTGIGSISPADHLRDIPESVPILFFASEDDRYARIADVRAMTNSIRTHARITSVKGGSHGRFLSIHEAEYRQAILDLAAEVGR